MDPRLQAGLELQLEKQAQQEHDSSLSGVLGQYFKQAEETAKPEFSNHPYSSLKTGPEVAVEKILTHPLWKKIWSKVSYPGQHARPQRGVPGEAKEYILPFRGRQERKGLTREQWYDNAMSHRYNKGQISEQEYQEYANPKSTGAAKTLRDILGGAKNIAKRYGEDFMKGTPGTAGTAADRTLEGTAADLEERRKRGERPTKSYWEQIGPYEKSK